MAVGIIRGKAVAAATALHSASRRFHPCLVLKGLEGSPRISQGSADPHDGCPYETVLVAAPPHCATLALTVENFINYISIFNY